VKLIILFLFVFLKPVFAQKLEINWSDTFRKEIHLSCDAAETVCEDICNASSFCILQEGICPNCIGTGIQILHIFSEIGRSIHRVDQSSLASLGKLLIQGDFVTFSAQEVYNLIDAHQSISVFKKFESLCPDKSLNQILFFKTHPESRRLISPEYLYCEFQDKSEIFKIEDKILIKEGAILSVKSFDR